MRAQVVSTGAYVPEKVVSNASLTQFPPKVIPLIEQKTGVRERRHADESQCTSDLAVEAARPCLERAGVDPGTVDALILTTSSPDRIQPATATRVQEKIGARRAFAFDLNSVCSGGVYALHVADALIRAGSARTVLVVASEVYSRYLNPKDFSTFPYFGDGAGAVLLTAAEGERGILGSVLGSDGSGDHAIQIPAGGTMLPYGKLTRPNDVYFKMRGREVYDFAVTHGSAVVEQVLDKCGIPKGDVAFVIPHQANRNIIQELASRLDIDLDRFVINLDRYGNTAAASVLIALDELRQSGRLSEGDNVVLVAFGGGPFMGSNADPKLTDALRTGLATAISEVFDSQVSDLRDDLPLGDIDGWDSMNAVNLTLELESAFDVELAGVILTADQTIADVLGLLRERGATG